MANAEVSKFMAEQTKRKMEAFYYVRNAMDKLDDGYNNKSIAGLTRVSNDLYNELTCWGQFEDKFKETFLLCCIVHDDLNLYKMLYPNGDEES